MATILYREQQSTGRTAALIAAVAVALSVIDVATGFALQGWGVLISVFLLIVAATLWGLSRYSSIRLTPERLVVGRASLTPADFERDYGVQAADALTDREHSLVVDPVPIPKDASVELLGGAWGKPMGTGLLVLRRVGSDKKSVITTRNVDALGPLLGEWLTSDRPPDLPPPGA
jgi:hypothetical protein